MYKIETDSNNLEAFFKEYPVPSSVIEEALLNYNAEDLSFSFDCKDILYEKEFSVNYEDNNPYSAGYARGYGNGVFKQQLTKIGTYNSRDICFSNLDKHIVYLDGENITDTDIKFVSWDNSSNTAKYEIRNINGDFESQLFITPQGVSYNPESLSENDLNVIKDSIKIEFTSPWDAHWQIDDSKEVIKVEDIDSLFKDLKFDEKMKNDFIKAMYEKKDEYDESENTITYTKYVLKEIPDYETAEDILKKYKENTFKERFSYYKYDENSNCYVLKEELNNEEKSKLNEICEKVKLGKMKGLTVKQKFNSEHLYPVEKGKYSIVSVDDSMNINSVEKNLEKNSFDSSKDFSGNNLNNNRTITVNVNDPKIVFNDVKEFINENDFILDDKVEVSISNDEILYGGEKNWFYGIWKGNLNNNLFDEAKIKLSLNNKNSFNKDEIKKKKESITFTNKEEDSKKIASVKIEDENSYYTPVKLDDTIYGIDKDTYKNPDVEYSVDYSKALVGNISVCKENVESAGDTNCYYTPFITVDIIHCDRAGGNSYYKIEGLADTEDEPGNCVPTINKNFTEGTDNSVKANLSLGESDSLTFGGNWGWNESISKTSQMISDFNSDGIPDIVQNGNTGLVVYIGTKDNNNVIYYSAENSTALSVSDSISSTESNTWPSFSCGFTGSGNVSVSKGKVLLGLSSGPGVSWSESTTNQKSGFIDFNGDGILDYYTGTGVMLNDGNSIYEKIWGNDNNLKIYTNKSVNISVTNDCSFGPSGADNNASNEQLQEAAKNALEQSGVTGEQNQDASRISNSLNGGIGESVTTSTSNTTRMFSDINGDGLQDILEYNGMVIVYYNTGNGFTNAVKISLPDWDLSKVSSKISNDEDLSGVVKGTILQNCIIKTDSNSSVLDVEVKKKETELSKKLSPNSLEWSQSIGLGINGNFGFSSNIQIPGLGANVWNFSFSSSSGLNGSINKSETTSKMMDLDGDGLIDHVLYSSDKKIFWKRNCSGTYGQLKQINLPQGGNIQIEYAEKYGTSQAPGFKYVMNKVTVNDGCLSENEDKSGGKHSIVTEYVYDNGYYDRDEKENYGFGKVKTIFADGSYRIDYYNQGEYYSKGSLKESYSYSNNGNILSKSVTELWENPYALAKREESWTYEESSGDGEYVYVKNEYEYDNQSTGRLSQGNCTKVVQYYGDGEKVTGCISYIDPDKDKYIVGFPEEILVLDRNDNTIRRRQGTYNHNG